jgi:hypothetical protein
MLNRGENAMEMTFRLSDEIIQQLRQLPNPDQFVGDVLRNALRDTAFRRSASEMPASKWAQIAQRIEEHPVGLNGYATQLQQDMKEFRDNFAFGEEA